MPVLMQLSPDEAPDKERSLKKMKIPFWQFQISTLDISCLSFGLSCSVLQVRSHFGLGKAHSASFLALEAGLHCKLLLYLGLC
jgi:hypothetical protein